MEKADLEYFRKFLTRQLEGLLNSARRTANDLLNEEDPHYTDYTDLASFDEGQNLRFRIHNRESNLIKKIQTALRRIESGEFGVCEDCGEDIPATRLMARPVTTKCIECKTREEFAEKVAGF
ncbi:MAG: RNA polymerase-binding protein DksA [Pseudomonadota bacterium]|jgi:DnaK suppressor protein